MSPESKKSNSNNFHSSRHLIQSLKAKADAKRTFIEKLADALTELFGGVPFLAFNAVWFLVWIALNVEVIPEIKPFDPFPFGLLTMIVSLEAIFLSIIVLISQNREEQINDLRAEMDLQLDIISERRSEKIMDVLVQLCEKNGIKVSRDESVQEAMGTTDVNKIEQTLEKQIKK